MAGTAAFFAWSDSQLSLGDSNAKEALAAPEEGAPYYALLAADLAKNTAAPSSSDEAYLAVRIDEGARTLTFISLPPSVSVELSDGERHALRDAASVGGDAELSGPPGRCSGFSSPTSRPPMPRASPPWSIWWGACPWSCPRRWTTLGPVSMCWAARSQTLDGAQALTLLSGGQLQRCNGNAGEERVGPVHGEPWPSAPPRRGPFFPSVIADGAPFVSTDWTSGQLISLGDALSPLTEATVYAAVVPGRLTTSDEGEETYEVSDEDLAAMMEAVNAGNSPESFEANSRNVDRSLVTVEVRNGSGIQ